MNLLKVPSKAKPDHACMHLKTVITDDTVVYLGSGNAPANSEYSGSWEYAVPSCFPSHVTGASKLFTEVFCDSITQQ